MKCFNLRALHSLRHGADRRARIGKETLETALHAPRSFRSSAKKMRSGMAPVLSCALLGLTALTAHAQDAPKPDEPKPAQAAAPAAPAGPAPGTVSITGLVDWYYGINARAPRSAAGGPFGGVATASGEVIGIDNVGRSFDINDREPSFSLGEVNITRTPGKGFPLGITATLTFGDTAKLVHANEPGGTSGWSAIQQLYVTYAPHFLNRDWTIDFGAFVTPFGQEVIESSSNDEYSRGLLFQFAIPLYHAGLRIGVPLSNTVTATALVVNGWNDIADSNHAKSIGAQLAWKPNAKITAIFGWMGGSEGTGAYGAAIPINAGNIETHLYEFLPTYQVNDKLKLAAEVDYGSAAGDVFGVHLSGNWLGYAGYAKYQLTPKIAIAGRVEQFEDMPGAGGFVPRGSGPAYQKLNSATLTVEYAAFRGHLISRLEYRHDHSRSPIFGTGTGAAVNDQDTFYLGEVYKF